MDAEDDQVVNTATLLSLPDELLVAIVSFLGRTKLRPSPAPFPLFASCRRLYHLSRDVVTRTEFLIGNYGASHVVEGCGSWLALLNPEAVSLLLHRVATAFPEGKVPRYQLQRMFRRFSNAGRSDLFLPLLTIATETYPRPQSASNKPIRAGLPPTAGMGFNPSLPDDELFKKLVTTSGRDVPEELQYLVEEAKTEGWHVPGDAVMSALLTLKNKYNFDPNDFMSGLSPSSSLLLNRDTGGPIHGGWGAFGAGRMNLGTGGYNTDFGVEGLNGGYVLLTRSISDGSEAAVRRLLRLGTELDWRSGNNFFWKSMDAARQFLAEKAGATENDTGNNNDNPLDMAYEYRYGGRAAQDLVDWYLGQNGKSLDTISPTIRPKDEEILRAVGDKFLRSAAVGYSGVDAIRATVSTPQEARYETILRLILEHAQETGWLQTPAGRESVTACIAASLNSDKIRYVTLLQDYSRAIDTEDRSLVSVLCEDNVEEAAKLIKEGNRLSEFTNRRLLRQQPLSCMLINVLVLIDNEQMVSILKSRQLPQAHTLLREEYPFTSDQLTQVLTTLMSSAAYNGRERIITTVIAFLETRGRILPDRSGKALACKWFEDSHLDWARPQLRKVIGPLAGSNNAKSLLLYDLAEACRNSNANDIRKLVRLGATVAANAFTRFYPRHSGNIALDSVAVFIEAQKYNPVDLAEILLAYLPGGSNPEFIDWLLDRQRKVKPVVGDQALRACMTGLRADRGLEVFKKLLEVAKLQPNLVDKPRLVRNMATKRGGEWQAAWAAYERLY